MRSGSAVGQWMTDWMSDWMNRSPPSPPQCLSTLWNLSKKVMRVRVNVLLAAWYAKNGCRKDEAEQEKREEKVIVTGLNEEMNERRQPSGEWESDDDKEASFRLGDSGDSAVETVGADKWRVDECKSSSSSTAADECTNRANDAQKSEVERARWLNDCEPRWLEEENLGCCKTVSVCAYVCPLMDCARRGERWRLPPVKWRRAGDRQQIGRRSQVQKKRKSLFCKKNKKKMR